VLDASGSFDPGGGPLRYRWRLLMAPDAAGLGLGDLPAGDAERVELGAEAPGTYRFGLHVWDAAGQVSVPAGASAFVAP